MTKIKRVIRRIIPLVTAVGLLVLLFPLPALAACPTTLTLTVTSAPYLVVDSNKPLEEGPMVATLSANITNTGASTANDIYVYIGNGTTPGTFPVDGYGDSLSLLGGAPDATRYIVNLTPGQSKPIFWQIVYPRTYDRAYSYTVWASNEDGCSVSTTGNVTTRSTISAAANKLLGVMTIDPPSGIVNPGNILTVTLTDFNLGTVGSGDDALLSPIGNLDFNPSCFRLVKTEAVILSITGSSPVFNKLYFPGIATAYSHDDNDYVNYYFVALGSCTTTPIKPYNEVASGTQYKYPKDYGVTVTVTSNSGGLGFSKSVNPTSAHAGDTLTWTITYTNNTAYPIGDPDSGNGLVVLDESIPANTTYVAGSSNCTGYSCVKLFSTDNGTTWTAIEPAPASINKIKWYINAQIPPGGSGTVQFQTTVNAGTPDCTQICNTARASIDGGSELASSTICTESAQIFVPLTGSTTFCYSDNTT
ncbi:MAG: DUF11 domain-containing protein, partial [Chloroflexota bacterium]